MSFIKSNLDQFLRDLDKADQERIGAGRASVWVESKRLRDQLKKEIRAGAPGGSAFTPLGPIASYRLEMTKARYYRRYKKRAMKQLRRYKNPTVTIDMLTDLRLYRNVDPAGKGRPLYGMARFMASQIASKSPYRVQVGLGKQYAQGLVAAFREAQAGGTEGVPGAFRRKLAVFGGELKQDRQSVWRSFFLRKETTTFTTPARDIIDSFFAAHAGEIMPNIQSNYERKLRGEHLSGGRRG